MNQFVLKRPQRKRTEVWQIIYMDLMTIIMVFFVILWSISQGKDAGVTDAVGDQTVRMVSLPGDVLFPTGKHQLTEQGRQVFNKLFADDTGAVLNFDTGGLTHRLLVIHGHTDSDGDKDKNLLLGYQRAHAVYKEIQKYGPQIADHAILCTHADNSPVQETPVFQGEITPAQKAALREAKAQNRRITIEDKIVTANDQEE
ncbi:MAG: OmpA family protein [Proteobacteria bacterium]|nr:OmpA family protein [Pseudomonadota bacterium]